MHKVCVCVCVWFSKKIMCAHIKLLHAAFIVKTELIITFNQTDACYIHWKFRHKLLSI